MKLHSSILIVLLLFTPLFISTGTGSNRNPVILNDGLESADFVSKLELAVYHELNLARTDPAGYAEYLVEFKQYYRGKYVEIPGEITLVTNEGLRAVEEAIRFLKNQKPLDPFILSKGMTLAAKNQVKYQGPRGSTGHNGKNGSSPFDRMNLYGKWSGTAGENIDYGNNTARRIVFALIIDDGVSSRGHRENIFNEGFKLVGIGCGKHKRYNYMCVMDFAGSYREK